MKRDKLFRLSLAILFLWTSLAFAAPASLAESSTALLGSSLWEPYLQQSRIDLEDAASSPWETLKSFLPQSFGALVRQTASHYTSVLLFLTLTAVLGLLVWQLKRRIERQEARQEAAEKAREEFETNLYESSLAAIALGEARDR